MRVIVPYVSLHPLTLRSILKYAPDADLAELFGDDGYYRLLLECWEAGESFLIVEQDIELHPGVLPQLERCPEPWCLFPYPGPTDSRTEEALLYRSLGCTRFTAQLMREVPDLMTALQVRGWRQLDCNIYPALTGKGYEPHVHWPKVEHHHWREDRRRCDCKKDHPER